ncbi:MAG: hypothetical protein AAF797_16395 [Planctomycetota bacterium]
MRLVGSHPNLTIARLDQLQHALHLSCPHTHQPAHTPLHPADRLDLSPSHASLACPPCHAADDPRDSPSVTQPAEPTPPILPELPPRPSQSATDTAPPVLPLYTPIFVPSHLIDVFA